MQGRFTPGRRGRRMVRAPPARAHPPLHARQLRREIEPVAAARLRALPVRMAARHRRRTRQRSRRRWPACCSSSKASRRRPRPGKPNCCRRACATTRSPGSTTCAPPAACCGRGCAAQRRPMAAAAPARCARRRSLLLPRRTAPLWTRLAPAPRRGRRAGLARAARGRLPARPRRLVLRRDRRRRAPAAHRTRGRAGRTGRARPRALRQLRRPARAAGAGVEAQPVGVAPPAAARRCSASRMPVAGRWCAAPAATPRASRSPDDDRTHRPRAAAPLRRGLLAPARTRGRMAAAMARPDARLPPPRSARRDPRRPLHRRPPRRTVRVARSRRRDAQHPPASRTTAASSRSAATDPANLLGTLLPGDKVPRIPGSRVVFRDGIPVATSIGGQVVLLTELDVQAQRDAEAALRRAPANDLYATAGSVTCRLRPERA